MRHLNAGRLVARIRHRLKADIATCVIGAAIVFAVGACNDDVTTPQARPAPSTKPSGDAIPNGAPQLDAGGDFTCGVRSDARVMCWGINNGQQLSVPAGLTGVTQVASGNFHACALLASASLRCWGANFTDPTLAGYNYGQTGVPAFLTGVQQVVAGGFHTCILSQSGTVSCWGRDDYGQSTPPAGLSGVTQLSADYFHTCALKSTGTVACWGYPDARTVVPPTLANAVQITTGGEHSCALTSGSQVVCWGVNGHGEMVVPSPLNASQVSAGLTHVCALRTNGTVICWGNDDLGQTNVPDGLSGVTQVSAGFSHTCALKFDLSVVCWGNFVGTLPPASLANHPPSVSLPDTTYGDEGVGITFDSHGADPDPNTQLSYTWQWYLGSGDSTKFPQRGPTFGVITNGPAVYRIKVVASDGQLADTAMTYVIVRNLAPKFVSINAPAGPTAAGSALTVSGDVFDQGQADVLGVGVQWGAGNSFIPAQVTQQAGNYNPAVNRPYTLSRSDLTPGVYELSLRVSDPFGLSKDTTLTDFLVIYDPSAGYVTGKGAIKSPLGACRLTCAGAEGRATFGFTSKYANGATVPTGSTQFEFKAGNLNFVSTVYQWLTVAGARAQFKGDGTINGAGTYGFLLTAVDGDLPGGGGVDQFRIKIWDKSSGLVVYDNQMGDADDSNLTTALASGSIIIKK